MDKISVPSWLILVALPLAVTPTRVGGCGAGGVFKFTSAPDSHGSSVEYTQGTTTLYLGTIGRTMKEAEISLIIPLTYSLGNTTYEVRSEEGEVKIFVSHDLAKNATSIKVSWKTDSSTRLEDCFSFGDLEWFGGPMHDDQRYPIQKDQYTHQPYVVTNRGAIMERYWINSAGQFFYVYPEVPLFVDYNKTMPNHICLEARVDKPYSSSRLNNTLSYEIWFLPDIKAAHKHAVATFLGKPTEVPDYQMIQYPIWSTWAELGRDINQSNLLQYANDIDQHDFSCSQFEIDDGWEKCYGSLVADETKFSNFTNMVKEIQDLGFKVTLWVHPFINKDCNPWYTTALEKGYFLETANDTVDASWWNSNEGGASYVDFTNPEAAQWWVERVNSLRTLYGVEGFKCAGGETNYAPCGAVQHVDAELQPNAMVADFVRACARLRGLTEVRTGFATQDLPIFVRMPDRSSVWGFNNGLRSVIATTFQMNLNGYTMVIPDKIGGNTMGDSDVKNIGEKTCKKELFIRWLQLTTFLPVMQFSFAPWNFDEETVKISKKFAKLHAEYAGEIYKAMKESVKRGRPVNAPIWWIAPRDTEALKIWDEFLVGDSILVAPILRKGVTHRDIYLPAGTWYSEGDPLKKIKGPTTLKRFQAPLDTLPFFVRKTEDNNEECEMFDSHRKASFTPSPSTDLLGESFDKVLYLIENNFDVDEE